MPTAMSIECVSIAESSLLSLAERFRDAVAANTGDVRLRLLDYFAVLHIKTLDLCEIAFLGAVTRDELGHNSELLRCVHGLGRAVE
jgi:hypothetical protein